MGYPADTAPRPHTDLSWDDTHRPDAPDPTHAAADLADAHAELRALRQENARLRAQLNNTRTQAKAWKTVSSHEPFVESRGWWIAREARLLAELDEARARTEEAERARAVLEEVLRDGEGKRMVGVVVQVMQELGRRRNGVV